MMISNFQEVQTTVPNPSTNREVLLILRFTFLGSNMDKVGDGEIMGWGRRNQDGGYMRKLCYSLAVTSAVDNSSTVLFSSHCTNYVMRA